MVNKDDKHYSNITSRNINAASVTMCVEAILQKGELTKVLTYGKQQLQFYEKNG